MKVVFRTDASAAIGTGHMVRCLALADALKADGANVSFVCGTDMTAGVAMASAAGFDVYPIAPPAKGSATEAWRIDAQLTLRHLGAEPDPADWLVVDRYSLGSEWESEIRAGVSRVLAIDDLADREHACDLLLDQNLVAGMTTRYDGKLRAGGRMLLGPRYALLQRPYRVWRERVVARTGAVRRVMIFFGGGDDGGLAGQTLAALGAFSLDGVRFDVVLGRHGASANSLAAKTGERRDIEFHHGLPSLAPLMAAADLAVGAAGATTWERLCLGLPSIAVTLAQNQVPIADELARRGLIRWVGDRDTIDPARIAAAVAAVVGDGLDPRWSESCRAVVDGRGVDRVCRAMKLVDELPLRVRRADAGDEALILAWANDETVRQNALSPAPIPADTHRIWFRQRTCENAEGRLYILETRGGMPLGQARFEPGAGGWEIHYSVAPNFRSRGFGLPMLEAAIARHSTEFGEAMLFGRVRRQNVASRRIFHELGFTEQPGETDDTIVFRRVPATVADDTFGEVCR